MSSPTWRDRWRRIADRLPVAGRRSNPISAGPDGSVALGSGRGADLGIAEKAASLDRLAAAGFGVPAGFVVPDGVEMSGESLDAWCASRGLTSLAVRSAFSAEDGTAESRAGWFLTRLDVAPGDVTAAIDEVRSSVATRGLEADSVRLDVLVMEMVPATRAGVAFSEPGTYDDVVNSTGGLADRLVSGEEEGERLLLPRLESVDAGWMRRLQSLLSDLRRKLGDEPWDVEWADDGSACWLVQVRPITAPTVRDEVLTLANHAEILPELPSTLMTSVIEHAGPDLFAWYRRRVPGLPSGRDFLHVVAGRPMINLSLLEDMMRHLGLPTALVAESIGGDVGGTSHPVAPGRLVRRSPSLLRLGFAQVTAVAFASRNERRIAAIGVDGASSFSEALDQLHDAYVALVTGMFPLSSAIGPPLSALRRFGVLHQHAGSHRTITTELSDRLAEVRIAPPGRRAAELDRFLADFGHRGVYESDIARPRFADEPGRFVVGSSAAGAGDGLVLHESSPGRRSLRWYPTRPLWWLAARPLAARERYRHEAMRSFSSIRRSLVRLADDAVEDGRLTAADDLWLLDVDRARSLDAGERVVAAEADGLRAERRRLAEIHPPHLVRRFDDPDDWGPDAAATGDRWSGLPLTTGRVSGRAWVLREPRDGLPDGFEPATTVLVARSIDAGWIATLASVAAVVVEIGGDLSHGSILVRELGLPAVTNVRGVTAALSDGDEITVDAGAGTIRRS